MGIRKSEWKFAGLLPITYVMSQGGCIPLILLANSPSITDHNFL